MTESNQDFDTSFDEFADAVASADQPENTPEPEAEPAAEPEGEQGAQEQDEDDAGADQPAEASEGDEEGEPAADAAQTGNIWENAPPELRAEYDAVVGRLEQTEHAYRSESGRVRPLNQQLSATQRENRELKARLAALNGGAADAADSKADDVPNFEEDADWQAIREEYPDVAGPIEKRILATSKEAASIRERLDQMDANQADDHALAEQTALASKHPDYREVAGSEPFTTWLANQPPMVIEAVQRNNERIVNADETSFVLDLFKSTLEAPTPEPAPEPEPQPEPEPDPEPEQQPASSRRALQRKSASAPSTSTVSSAADGPKDDFDAAFDHYAGKIDA